MSDITKKALVNSFKSLLKEKPFSKITISDITNDCGINRMTFYYHFKDIYDLIEWTCECDAKKILEGKKSYNTWQEGFSELLNHVKENKSYVLGLYHSISREQIENYLHKVTYFLILNVVKEKAQNYDIKETDMDFIANFYKFAFVGLVLDWVQSDMELDTHELISKVDALISGTIENTLKSMQPKKLLRQYTT